MIGPAQRQIGARGPGFLGFVRIFFDLFRLFFDFGPYGGPWALLGQDHGPFGPRAWTMGPMGPGPGPWAQGLDHIIFLGNNTFFF